MYVHRVDGPVDVYRGSDGGVDRHVYGESKIRGEVYFSIGIQPAKTP